MDDQILSLEHISLSYHTMEGETPALCDLTFSVKPGEFVAHVGPSGCGKSTMFQIITGRLQPDEGTVSLMKGTTVGFLTQHADIESDLTVTEELSRVFDDVKRMEARLRELEAEMAEKHADAQEMQRLSDAYARLTARFEDAGGYEWPSRVQGVLAADVVSRKAVRSFECFGDGIHLFWEGNPKALYEFKDGDKRFVNTYASFEHDSRYSDNVVENAYVDELTNFFGVLKGEEQPKWSFEKDLKAIELMDRIEKA